MGVLKERRGTGPATKSGSRFSWATLKEKLRGDNEGMTLIELMISVAVIVLVTLSAIYALTYAHYLSEESRGRLLALNTARSVLEEVKDTTIQGVTAINTAALIPADLPNGAIAITTNPANITAATQIATVTVTVSWSGPRNRAMNLQISTMRSRF